MSEIETKTPAGGVSGNEALSLDYTVQRHLGAKQFQDILCAALEGGIGYWACLDNGTAAWKKARAELREELKDEPDEWNREPCYDQIAVRVLQSGEPVLFSDAEEEGETPEELEWQLTAPALVAAAKRFQDERTAQLRRRDPRHPNAVYDLAEALDSDFDADDADTIIQYALFGELIYG